MSYESNKKWRKANPQSWAAWKLKYYRRTSNAMRAWERWSEADAALIMESDLPDSVLARELNRSVASIQMKRMKIRREEQDRNQAA